MESAAHSFVFEGTPTSCERYGQGHINVTYLVETTSGRRYILQRINRHVFRDIPALMQNIESVTHHLAQKDADPRHVLTLIPARTGGYTWVDEAGETWRAYAFIEDSICLEKAENPNDFQQSGVAFGRFQRQLADFPADTLSETIPGFHNTVSRYAQLHEAIERNSADRLQNVQPELEFYLAHEAEAARMVEMGRTGALPLRVTHNDTKLNNVMLDAKTRAPLCVIDLDTVMPGLAANDFGDSIRFGASTAAEDEPDLSLVSFSLPLYRAFARGFLQACGDSLTENEIETLPLGAKLMTLECGSRFLADYLSGDVYFRVKHPEHNLHRLRTQAKLVADMEQNWQAMQDIISEEMPSV